MMIEYQINILDDSHFTINDYLVDLVRIEHWGRHQGAGKFHGIRNAIGILQRFIYIAQDTETTEGLLTDPHQRERVVYALQRLSEYGYHVPPELIPK